MSDQQVDQSVLDALDTNISDIDTSYPIIHPKIYDMEIKSATIMAGKKNPGNLNLKVSVKTTEQLTSVTGEMVAKGLTLNKYIGVTPSEDRPADNIKKDVARLGKAAGVSGTAADILRQPAILVGKRVKVEVGVKKADAEYPESNEVRNFVVVR